MRALLKDNIHSGLDSDEYKKALDDLDIRYESDSKRYKEIYGVDYSSPKLYNDIVIDSSKINELSTFNLVVKLINDGGFYK